MISKGKVHPYCSMALSLLCAFVFILTPSIGSAQSPECKGLIAKLCAAVGPETKACQFAEKTPRECLQTGVSPLQRNLFFRCREEAPGCQQGA